MSHNGETQRRLPMNCSTISRRCGSVAVLREIETLPGPDREPAANDRNMQGHAVDHRFHMRRHVVRAFGVVHPAGIGRRQPVERGHEIGLHVGIGILLDDQRRRGVPEVSE